MGWLVNLRSSARAKLAAGLNRLFENAVRLENYLGFFFRGYKKIYQPTMISNSQIMTYKKMEGKNIHVK